MGLDSRRRHVRAPQVVRPCRPRRHEVAPSAIQRSHRRTNRGRRSGAASRTTPLTGSMTGDETGTGAPPGINFGRTAADYERHRPGFPADFFDRLLARRWIAPGQRALDLGADTGSLALGADTGSLALGFAERTRFHGPRRRTRVARSRAAGRHLIRPVSTVRRGSNGTLRSRVGELRSHERPGSAGGGSTRTRPSGKPGVSSHQVVASSSARSAICRLPAAPQIALKSWYRNTTLDGRRPGGTESIRST